MSEQPPSQPPFDPAAFLRKAFESEKNLFAAKPELLFDTLIKTKPYRKNLPFLSEDEKEVITHTKNIFIKNFRTDFKQTRYRDDWDLYTCVFGYVSDIFVTKLGNLRQERAAFYRQKVTLLKENFVSIDLKKLDNVSLRKQDPSCLYWSVVMNQGLPIEAKFRNSNDFLILGYEWFVKKPNGGFEKFAIRTGDIDADLKVWIEAYLNYRWRDAFIHKVGPMHRGKYRSVQKPVMDSVTGKPLIDPTTNKPVTKTVIERVKFVNPTVRDDGGEEVNILDQLSSTADIFSSLVEAEDIEILHETIADIFEGNVDEIEALEQFILGDAAISAVIRDYNLSNNFRYKVTNDALPKLRVFFLEKGLKPEVLNTIKEYLEKTPILEEKFENIRIEGKWVSVIDKSTTQISIKFLAQQFLPIFQHAPRTYEDVTKELIDTKGYKNLSIRKLKEFWENHGLLAVGKEITKCLKLIKKNNPPSGT